MNIPGPIFLPGSISVPITVLDQHTDLVLRARVADELAAFRAEGFFHLGNERRELREIADRYFFADRYVAQRAWILAHHGGKFWQGFSALLPHPAGSKLFTEKMNQAGNVCELVTSPAGGHGHINNDMKLFDDAIRRTEAFLAAQMGGGAGK